MLGGGAAVHVESFELVKWENEDGESRTGGGPTGTPNTAAT